ncbi:MAG: M24 family metallopeptidase [Bacteroidota bacterium]
MNAQLNKIYHPRVAALRKEMKALGLDSFVTSSGATLRYLCGYSGSNGMLVVTGRATIFLTDFRYKESSQTSVAADKKFITQGSLTKAAAEQKIFSPLKMVGYEKDKITVADFEVKKEFIGEKKLVPTAGISESLRSVKDTSELRTLKHAFDISDSVFDQILDIIEPGMTELELSAEISYLHKSFGAENDSFDVIVASGMRGSLPHGTATTKKLKRGEFITLDFGCLFNGYHSDMTRTVCLGKPTAEMKKVYSIVQDAQQRSCDAVRSGVRARDLDSIAREIITKAGYGKEFGHSLGHGVGLEIHELPRIAPKSTDILAEGNVITIEPGIYIPKKFGIRIEDTLVVRQNGFDVLTASPKELITL